VSSERPGVEPNTVELTVGIEKFERAFRCDADP